MDPKKTALERAFELADSGKAASTNDIRRTLDSEDYSSNQLTGSALLAQLRKLIQKAKPGEPSAPSCTDS